jgi:tetratricopeptide (TPR) repeat protein
MNTIKKYSLLLLITAFYSCTEQPKPVSREEALDFAKKLEESVYKKNEVPLNDAIDIKKTGITNNESDLQAFAGSMGKNIRLGSQVIASLGKKGLYQFVRQYEKDKVQHIIFRLFADGGLNYHDYQLIKKKGEIRIDDFFVYITGENFSKTLADLFVQFSVNLDSKDPKAIAGMEQMQQLKKVKSLSAEGKYTEAKKLIDELPADIHNQKIVQIYNLQVSSQLGDDIYTKAISEYQQYYPNEPNMQLILIDIYTIRKEYDKLFESINKLDSLLGKDPFLDYYRYLCSNLSKDETGARKYLERLNSNIPMFQDGALELMYMYARNKEFDKAAAVIKKLKTNRDFDSSSLSLYYLLYPQLKEKIN